MTYIDIQEIGLLTDAIYGGPRLEIGAVKRLLSAWKLVTPFDVFAVDTPKPFPESCLRIGKSRKVSRATGSVRNDSGSARVLTLHPGIAYVLEPTDISSVRSALELAGFAAGASETCAGPGDLVRAIQQAVLKLRRAQLSPGAATLTTLAEGQARALALHRVRAKHEGAAEAVRSWVDIVMNRHQDRLNTVRRKLVEGLCLLTLEQDVAADLAYPFQVALRRLVDTFSLPALREAFDLALIDIVPFLHAPPAGVSSLFDDAVAFLSSRFDQNIGLAQTARRVGCSEAYLSRLFKKQTGRTLTDHLQALRVSRARELLLETDSPLRVIAPKTGFATAKHFHRVFLKQTGMTPHAFRSSYRA